MKKIFLLLLVLALVFWLARKVVGGSIWPGRGRINWVVSQPPRFVSFEPSVSLVVVKLPEKLYLTVPGNLGEYPLGSVWQLGSLEGSGGELLRQTVQDYLRVPVEGYVKIPNDQFPMTNSKRFVLDSLFLLWQGRGETNLSFWDLARLYWQARKVRFDKVKSVDLTETSALFQEELPDGTVVWQTKFFHLRPWVKNFFQDSQIQKEALKIEVNNGTDHPGLAEEVAEMVENMGGVVIGVGNADNKIRNSKFEIRNEELKNSYTVWKLKKVLSAEVKVGGMGESRADLLILVGEDYKQRRQ